MEIIIIGVAGYVCEIIYTVIYCAVYVNFHQDTLQLVPCVV